MILDELLLRVDGRAVQLDLVIAVVLVGAVVYLDVDPVAIAGLAEGLGPSCQLDSTVLLFQ